MEILQVHIFDRFMTSRTVIVNSPDKQTLPDKFNSLRITSTQAKGVCSNVHRQVEKSGQVLVELFDLMVWPDREGSALNFCQPSKFLVQIRQRDGICIEK